MLNGHSRLVQAPLSRWRSMNDIIVVSLRDQRVQTMLLLTLSLFAVALTAGGVYGLLSFVLAVRAREFGVRLAIGASDSLRQRLGLLTRRAGVVLSPDDNGQVRSGFLRMEASTAGTTKRLSECSRAGRERKPSPSTPAISCGWPSRRTNVPDDVGIGSEAVGPGRKAEENDSVGAGEGIITVQQAPPDAASPAAP